MFIAIINFPIKPGKENEFVEWFSWSNKKLGDHQGLISRRLLKPLDSGNYLLFIEHESRETFMAGHGHPDHREADKKLAPLLGGEPIPQFYEGINE